MAKRSKQGNGSHADIKAAIHGQATPKKKKSFARQRLEERGIPLEGVSPAIRQDRPGRKNGGRSKETVNVIVAGSPPGIAPPLGLMRPSVGPLAAPVASTGRFPGAGRIGLPKGIDRNKPHATSGSPSYANGGCVSRGSSLADIRRKTQP